MTDPKEWKKIEKDSNKVLGIVSMSLLSIIMIIGWLIPFLIFNDVSGKISEGWNLYFILVLFIAVFSMIYPGIPLTSYFYRKYYKNK